jgi:hypothetical protein
MTVKFSDIEDAFLFVSSASYGECSAYVDIKTGRIHYQSDSAGIDEIGDEEADWEDMIAIPHKNDLDLGRQLVFDFVAARLPHDYDSVRDMFRARGAYSRFKDFLASKDLLEAWYDFENEREQETLRSWCEENQIPLSNDEGKDGK